MVVERLAYDPWGKRRFINGTADTLDAITSQTIDRGFTMHEHIDEMGIINMNGRIYDPLIGRFMSADPYIQAPDDLQSHNRYAYVMNNPLNLTDPSGFSWISKAWKKAWKSPIFRAVLGIVVAVVAPYALTWLAPTLFVASSLPLALATGALSGYASTGTLKGALTGAFTAGLMHGVGTIGVELGLESGGLGKIALHAGAGCVSSVAGGGSCKSGAISGALGEAGLNLPDGGKVLNIAKAAMLGGLGSKLAGGKFEDGATTGAFGYLFNEIMHDSSKNNGKKFSLSNPHAMDELVKLNSALIDLGYADEKFQIRITGGDRYIDSVGDIRYATDDQRIPSSAKDSRHLISQGARDIDVNISGVSQTDLTKALATTDLKLLNVVYGDKHLHFDLPASKWFAPRR